MSNNASGEGSLDDSTPRSSMQSMLQTQSTDRPLRRRSLSMLEMNEMESIKKLGPVTDHYIGHDQNSDITATEVNTHGTNNNCDRLNVYNNVTVYFDNDNDDNSTCGSEERASIPQLTISSVSSNEETKGNAISSQDRNFSSPSILKSSISRNSTFQKSRASFSTLEIREYPTTLGDNPGGVQGPPISLDWNYSERKTQIIALEDYEKARLPRRKVSELRMNANMRTWMLLRERGFTLREINKASKMAESARLQRKKSTQSGPISNLKKKLKRIASRKN